jgi:TPR repeat protein
MRHIAWITAEGKEVTRDYALAEAARLLNLAHDHDPSGREALEIARAYEAGTVVSDVAKAFKWFLKSAEAGDREGMFHAGRCYLKGIGVPADKALAKKWLTKAAEAHYPVPPELLDQVK